MYQITGHLLKASSQRDMQRRFEEVSGEIEENASAALEVLEDGLFDAAATEALLAEKHEE
jgi:putative transposase